MALARLQRTFHTLRYLRSRQAFYYLWRRGIGARRLPPLRVALTKRALTVDFWLTHSEAPAPAYYQFDFLNQRRRFAAQSMLWSPADVNRLWRYNLHYFDFLLETDRSLAEKKTLIDDWIGANPPGSAPAWEPYTASLRIVNWCKFFWSLPAHDVRAEWLQSLHGQMRWLERNLEFHILANHLLANIKAMLFSSVFFEDQDAMRWLQQGQKLLCEQLREQTLPDGGHYERSPQYHCILLEDYLDLLQLEHSPSYGIFNAETLVTLRHTALQAMEFLQQIQTPDDDIPLFNDSASNAASRPSLIFRRATAMKLIPATLPPDSPHIIDLPASGLFGYRYGGDYLAMDCGDIGPAWQPGHTHCDFLSFVLMLRGQWLIVDSGVCEYEPGELRRYVRSTRAHNTIVVDEADQSEVWGEFRVARRARRLATTIETGDDSTVLKGAFQGFPTLGGIDHHRKIVVEHSTDSKIVALQIKDQIIGENFHHITSLLHLHPDLQTSIQDTQRVVIHSAEKYIATLHTYGFDHIKVTKGRYCPQFGMAIENDVIEMHVHIRLPHTCGYTFSVMEP